MMQKWRNESFVDVVNLILGAWLFATPWFYGFASGAAGWNAWIMGGSSPNFRYSSSHWALGFAESVGAMGNHVAVGIVVAALAAIELWLVHRKPPHVHA